MRRPDADQEAIIQAPVSAKLVVTAGPGYGKTDVACARVAHLLAQGLTGAQILLLSFTRTAVREMRVRIAQLAATNADVRGVEIRTIDSFAWSFNRGLAAQGVADIGTYEESIQRSLALFDRSRASARDVDEALGRYKHVLVDEAQDLVGVRAEWILAFLGRFAPEVGWTVFMDPAQAIYDWAEEGEGEEKEPASFVDLYEQRLGSFEPRTLRTFHRTANPPLASFLQQVRNIVPQGAGADAPAELRSFLLNIASGEGDDNDIHGLAARVKLDGEGGLILFRTRAEALSASSYLATGQVEHRLRFGGLPRLMAPWIAAVVNHLDQLRFDRSEFDSAWGAVSAVSRYLTWGWDPEDAWRTILRLGRPHGATRVREVNVELVADNVAQRRVPDDLFRKELGPGGPIIGTVHGSKGREAGHVVFFLSDRGREGRHEAEEERVLYVGVSRARNNLEIVKAPARQWWYHEGRAWRMGRDNVRIEVGRDTDVDLVSAARAPQQRLSTFSGAFQRVTLKSDKAAREKQLVLDDGTVLCRLSSNCVEQLNAIMHKACSSYCNFLAHLQWIDLTTAALRADDNRIADLPEPSRRTRLWLAPVIAGLGYAKKTGGNRVS